MGKKNQNWEPQIKKQMKGKPKLRKLGIDANSNERYNHLVKKKRGVGKIIAWLIVLLILFATFFSNGELIKNILKNLH